ncbi:hypothetical protein [Pseudorhodoferax soli]|uniref:hypothetical protein n=1 Tax=Pseudorhodoferax soli TaxID=545864 RepID=UPI0011C01EB2|nr:hypothetical protein [Pseudorhodoferax soli]
MSYLECSRAWKAAHLAADLAERRIFRGVLAGAQATPIEREVAKTLRLEAQEKLRAMVAACSADAARFPLAH